MQVVKKGQKVHFNAGFGQFENGKIKEVCSDKQNAMVVFYCGGNWDDYEKYTAAKTPISKLRAGWVDDAANMLQGGYQK